MVEAELAGHAVNVLRARSQHSVLDVNAQEHRENVVP